KNIRWGELVGGLLIVCCSIALVISFWTDIAERPFLKYGVFNGVTVALFGLGFYSYRRWRLQTTSRGLLLIAGLLVPLNFMAIAAERVAGADALTLFGEIASGVVFSALLFLAGRILTPRWPIQLAATIIAPSLTQLVLRRYAVDELSIPAIAGF